MKFFQIGVITLVSCWMLMVLFNKFLGPDNKVLSVLAQSGKSNQESTMKTTASMTFSDRFRSWLNEPMTWQELRTQRFNKPFIDKLNKWLDEPSQWAEIKKPTPGAYDADYIERFRRWWMEARAWDELKTKKFEAPFIMRFKNWWNLPQTWLEPLKSKLS